MHDDDCGVFAVDESELAYLGPCWLDTSSAASCSTRAAAPPARTGVCRSRSSKTPTTDAMNLDVALTEDIREELAARADEHRELLEAIELAVAQDPAFREAILELLGSPPAPMYREPAAPPRPPIIASDKSTPGGSSDARRKEDRMTTTCVCCGCDGERGDMVRVPDVGFAHRPCWRRQLQLEMEVFDDVGDAMPIETEIRLCPVCQDKMPADIGTWVAADIIEQGDDDQEIAAGLDFVCSRECAEQAGRPAIRRAGVQ